jgi:AcrR family transcriptional regulator
MSSRPLPEDGRARRRVEAMRRVQLAALDLAEERGMAGFTVEDVAAAAGVGPATVYRNFGTKERIILWDEYDPMILEEIRRELPNKPLLRATRDALAAALDRVYAEDKRRILRRARLVLRDTSLYAAGESDRASLRRALGEILVAHGRSALEAEVAAAASLAAMEVAVVQWVRGGGRIPMREVVARAFDALAVFAAGSAVRGR